MDTIESRRYDPREFKALTFHDATTQFREGRDTPRAYLERCLATVAAREPVVKAFVTRNDEGRARRSRRQHRALEGRPPALAHRRHADRDQGPARDEGHAHRFRLRGLQGKHDPARQRRGMGAAAGGRRHIRQDRDGELGGSHPPATTNPFDPARTPGGSSSGSAAAVGARMVPAALGTQVGGSVIRPAAYCANIALKPTQGAINRGERQATSMSTTGVHAGSIEDMWQVAIEIARRAGGDPGRMGLFGPATPPAAVKPGRLIVLETEGWSRVEAPTRTAFESIMESLSRAGVTLLRRKDHPWIEAFEKSIANASNVANGITAWENRWYQAALVELYPGGVSERLKATVRRAESMSPDDYRSLLLERAAAQQCHAAVGPLADAVIKLSCPAPAPVWSGDVPGEPLAPRPTGDSVFNTASSMLHAPAVTMPLIGVGGMPVGVQLMGQQHEDARMTALARWMLGSVTPVVA
jgi:Asp-tRNA(Asn)/Glu-tRNA(Gln) amidotransferase A subunit family amidase